MGRSGGTVHGTEFWENAIGPVSRQGAYAIGPVSRQGAYSLEKARRGIIYDILVSW